MDQDDSERDGRRIDMRTPEELRELTRQTRLLLREADRMLVEQRLITAQTDLRLFESRALLARSAVRRTEVRLLVPHQV